MKNGLYDHGFGTDWSDLYIQRREGYYTSVADFHQHPFYEINLILSGNVRILLKDRAEDGCGNFIVLTRPQTPHFISCKPDTLYSRLYLSFSDAFIADCIPEWDTLETVFGKTGSIIPLTGEQTALCEETITRIQKETAPFRQRLLILYLLSQLNEFAGGKRPMAAAPAYVIGALSYIGTHYSEKIVAEELARRLFISRTTLMTGFKKYTGTTLNEYLIRYRLKNVLHLLQQGKTEQEAAERCGLYDSSGLIRSFKQRYGMTPRQYLNRKDR